MKLSWHKCVAHGPFSHLFKILLCGCVFWVQVQSTTGPPTSAMESQVLFTQLNEIHFDVTFERITSPYGSRQEVCSLLCYWLKPTTVHLSFSDGRYLWPWAIIGRGEALPAPYTLHLSKFCLAVSHLSVSAVLLYYTACFSWYITQMEFLVISKPGQIAFVDPSDCGCNGHLCSTPRCSTPTDDEFDFCPFSSLQGWSMKVNFEIPHKIFTVAIRLSECRRGHLYVCMASCCLSPKQCRSVFFFSRAYG